jgi:hypothetical protein
VTDEKRCLCGKPTDQSLTLAWLTFAPAPPDQPAFTAPFCDDCRDAVWGRLRLDRARWKAERANARVRQLETGGVNG